MSELESELKCVDDKLILNVKKKVPKFKAGSELSGSVNIVDVEWDKEHKDDVEIVKVSLRLSSKDCVK